jgi:uncharacterized protein (TIRG00374 family)
MTVAGDAQPVSGSGSAAKRIVLFMAKLAVTLSILGWLYARIDIADVVARLSRIDLAFLSLAILLAASQLPIGALRWQTVLHGLAVRAPLVRTLRLFLVAVFFNTCLPGGVGGDAYRIWGLRGGTITLSTALNSVVLERSLVLLALFVCMIIEYPLLSERIGVDTGVRLIPVLAVAGIAALAVVVGLDRVVQRWSGWRAVHVLALLGRDARHFLLQTSAIVPGVLLSALGISLYCLTIYLLARGLGVALAIGDSFLLVPPVMLITAVPITIGGWGLREGAMVVLLGRAGIAAESALALSVVAGLIVMVVSLVGGFVWLFPDKYGQNKWR